MTSAREKNGFVNRDFALLSEVSSSGKTLSSSALSTFTFYKISDLNQVDKMYIISIETDKYFFITW